MKDEARTCKSCGKYFKITEKEIEWYKARNLHLPVRCKQCRDKRKANKQKEEQS